MYIEKIKIDKFRVLEDIEIHFQPPGGTTADPETGNVVNIIAGVNGCGKTSVLEVIFDLQQRLFDFEKNKSGLNYDGRIFDLIIEKIPATEDFLFLTKQGRFYFKYPELAFHNESFEGQVLSDHIKMIYFNFDDFSRKNKNQYGSYNNFPERMYEGIEDVITNYLLSLERTIEEANPALRSKKALEEFNNIFNGIDFYTKLQVVSYENGRMKPEFVNANGEKVKLNDLSDGEQRLYMSTMNLMKNFFQDCIILMDEPEVALHPAWQQKIMQIYSRIGRNNQFIIATHSPQIIANTPYQNLIILKKENDKITPCYPSSPPIGTDVNSILSDFMGVNGEYPEDIMNLHRKYRQFVKDGKENLQEAIIVKNKLLEKESNDSRFMQEMRLLQRWRKFK